MNISGEPRNYSLQKFRLFTIIVKKRESEKEKMARKDSLNNEHQSSFNAKRLKYNGSLTNCRKIVKNSSLQKYIHKKKTFIMLNSSSSKEMHRMKKKFNRRKKSHHKEYFTIEKEKNHDVNKFNKYEKEVLRHFYR